MAHINIDETAIVHLATDPAGPIAKEVLRRAIKTEAAAKRLCPVDTGRLRASIGHELHETPIGIEATVGSHVEYALYVEMGTRHMRAQPYLRPAIIEAMLK